MIKIKKILMLLLMLLTFNTNYKLVYAEGGGGGGGGGGSAGNWNGVVNASGNPGCGAGVLSYCSYSWNWNKETNVEIEMLDLEGNRNQTSLFAHITHNEFLAGTYVMLKVYQTQEFKYHSSYEAKQLTPWFVCKHYEEVEREVCVRETATGICLETGTTKIRVLRKVYEAPRTCGGDECAGFAGWEDTTGNGWADECGGYIEKVDKTLEPMYEAHYKDSNDINGPDPPPIKGHECSKSSPIIEPNSNGMAGNTTTINNECYVSYDKEAEICINVKNGNVTYYDGQKNVQCGEDEMKVTPNSDGYWKYFIPLNANSADDFSFELKSSNAIEEDYICNDIKSKYSYWDNIIDEVPGGCVFNTKITIPIVQRFYNELEDGKTFKGFNFYYKPIDINEPFPNGLTDTSIWNECNGTNPNISQSYDKMIYYANTSQNEQEIRKYNDKKNDIYTPYASWEKLNKDGTSQFVRNSGIMDEGKVSLPDKNSFYNLGCGPKNTNVNNVFTQTECDR